MEATVCFETMKVKKENLLGNMGHGFDILLSWIAVDKIQQCAACVSIAQAALNKAAKRTVRGRPLANMQGIQWILADVQSKLEASRWLTYRSAFMQDREKKGWMIAAASAKLFVVPTAIDAVEMARRIHGAYGSKVTK